MGVGFVWGEEGLEECFQPESDGVFFVRLCRVGEPSLPFFVVEYGVHCVGTDDDGCIVGLFFFIV